KLRKRIKSRLKNATPPEKKSLSRLLSINPEDVNIDEFNRVANEVTQSYRSVTDKKHVPLKLRNVDEFVEGEVNSLFAKEFPDNKDILTTDEKLALLKEKRAQ